MIEYLHSETRYNTNVLQKSGTVTYVTIMFVRLKLEVLPSKQKRYVVAMNKAGKI